MEIRFRQLGALPEFQRIQMDALRPKIDSARAAMAALGLRSERAFAYVYDTTFSFGQHAVSPPRFAASAAVFSGEVGRPPDEEEKFLILANIVNSRGAVRALHSNRLRQLTLATGSGTVFGRTLHLDDLGLSYRDAQTGQPMPHFSDPETRRRLLDGWVPARS